MEFCKAVGGGDLEKGIKRVLMYLTAHRDDLYLQCGHEKGLAVPDLMDADALAAMSADCGLKLWQLERVLKYVKYATKMKLTSVSVKEMQKKFTAELVVPITGKVWHETTNKNGETKVEEVSYDYQDLVEVFKYVTASLLMDGGVDVIDVKRVCLVLGGDHGVGAFRLTIRILIRLKNGKVLKDDIGISSVFAKDTSEVLKMLDLAHTLVTLNSSSTL
jgi:hypothetical protein